MAVSDPGRGVPPTVLAVDDDPVSLVVLRHMVGRLGCRVVAATGVNTAREALADTAVDLVVCDYALPDGTGLDLLDDAASVPFVLLTGVAERHEMGDERIAGVTDYLTKPVSSEQLAAVVTSLLAAPDGGEGQSGRAASVAEVQSANTAVSSSSASASPPATVSGSRATVDSPSA